MGPAAWFRRRPVGTTLEAAGTTFDAKCGGNHAIPLPPPPECLREQTRLVWISEDHGGADERQQLPTSQRITPEVARRQPVRNTPQFAIRLPPPPPFDPPSSRLRRAEGSLMASHRQGECPP
jgi:hypothetical protein